MNKEAPLNVCNFKDGEWWMEYTIWSSFTEYSFCEKNDESSTVCQGFSEMSRRKLSPLISY